MRIKISVTYKYCRNALVLIVIRLSSNILYIQFVKIYFYRKVIYSHCYFAILFQIFKEFPCIYMLYTYCT